MEEESMRRNIPDWGYDFFIVSVLFIISMLLRVHKYEVLSVMPDEIAYSAYTYSILSHCWSWPPEFMGAQPPLFPYMLAIITYLFEGGLDMFRPVSILFGSLSVCVIYFLGKSLYNRSVGMLSAILLCFCSYHILYSRIVMLEALSIFLIYASMYYFWKSYNKEDDIKYAIASGVFLGLACDTKYNALLLYVSFILFILWIKRKGWFLGWKDLLRRKYFVLFFTSILIFLPVLIDQCINGVVPFAWQLFGRFQTRVASYKTAGEFGILPLLQHGFENYIDMIIDGHSVATLSLSWLPAFYVAAALIFTITLLHFLFLLLKSQPGGSFLMITFIVFNAFLALFGTRFQYYLLWGLPAFFIMISYLIVHFIESFRLQIAGRESTSSLKTPAEILVLALVSIFIFSYIVVGTIAPSVNEGFQAGYEKQVINIKDKIQPGECIATDLDAIITHYLDEYDIKTDEHNIFILPLFKSEKRLYYTSIEVNIELLDRVKPRFIITSVYYFSAYTTVRVNKEIREDYNLFSNENGVLLYERKI